MLCTGGDLYEQVKEIAIRSDLDILNHASGQGNSLGYLLISLPALFFYDSIRSDNNRVIYFVPKDSSIN